MKTWSLVAAEGHAVGPAAPFPFQSVLGVELGCGEQKPTGDPPRRVRPDKSGLRMTGGGIFLNE